MNTPSVSNEIAFPVTLTIPEDEDHHGSEEVHDDRKTLDASLRWLEGTPYTITDRDGRTVEL